MIWKTFKVVKHHERIYVITAEKNHYCQERNAWRVRIYPSLGKQALLFHGNILSSLLLHRPQYQLRWICPSHTIELEIHSFPTSAPEEGEWSSSRPGCFTPSEGHQTSTDYKFGWTSREPNHDLSVAQPTGKSLYGTRCPGSTSI